MQKRINLVEETVEPTINTSNSAEKKYIFTGYVVVCFLYNGDK